jgi:uncharacterized membrane protein YjgN (DUF898 family)
LSANAATPLTSAPAPDPCSAETTARFLGSERAYWKLRTKGAVLLALTLGLYRFWFATDVRRFLWSNTEIGGDTLEYTGLATELLGGFLIAAAILVPLYTAIAGAALAFEQWEGAIAIGSVVFLFWLSQYALFRARRYRLTRTVFRGVTFDQYGSAWRFACLSLGWWALVVITLGLAYPFAAAALERYKLRHTSFGDLTGSFAGSGATLFRRGLPIWLLVVAPIIVGFIGVAEMVDWEAFGQMLATSADDADPATVRAATSGLHWLFVIAVLSLGVSVVAAIALYPLFQALVLRWWIAGLRFGSLSVDSLLPVGKVYRIYLRFLGFVVLFAIFIVILGGGAALLFASAPGVAESSALNETIAAIATLSAYVIFALGASTIYQVVVSFGMWRLGTASAVVSGAGVLDGVRAAGAPSSALGEGLVDALGVGGV